MKRGTMGPLFSVLLGVLILGAFFCSLNSTAFAANNPVIIKLGHETGTSHQLHLACVKFKEYVEKVSDGKLKIDIYPAAQLGRGKELAEGLVTGTIEMMNISPYSLTFLGVTEVELLEMPYVFRDLAHAYKVLDGQVLSDLHEKFERIGVRIVDYFEIGLRHMTNSKRQIQKPEDLRGMKMRVQPTKMWLEFAKLLGVIGTPVSFADLYSALQQGVADGQENPIATIRATKVYEVQKYLSLTAHAYTPAPICIGATFFNKLPKDSQQIIKDGARKAALWERQYMRDNESKDLEFLKSQGVQVEEKPDIEAFRKATQPLFEIMGFPSDLVKKVVDAR